jgi:hypothetical protein
MNTSCRTAFRESGGGGNRVQRSPIQQAKQVNGIGTFIGIAGLSGDHTGRQDDQCVWVLRGVG